MRRIVSALLLACLCGSALASDEAWFSVHLDGRKIGHMHSQRSVDADARVVHEQSLSLTMQRQGEVDDLDPRTHLGSSEAWRLPSSRGSTRRAWHALRRHPRWRTIELKTEQQGVTQSRSCLPKGACSPKASARVAASGRTPARAIACWLRSGFAASDHARHAGRRRRQCRYPRPVERLVIVDQSMSIGGARPRPQLAGSADAGAAPHAPAGHWLTLEMLACDRQCALAPVQPPTSSLHGDRRTAKPFDARNASSRCATS